MDQLFRIIQAHLPERYQLSVKFRYSTVSKHKLRCELQFLLALQVQPAQVQRLKEQERLWRFLPARLLPFS